MKFCGGCGHALPAGCPSCGAEAPSGFKFCGACGSPLQSTSESKAAPAPTAFADAQPNAASPALRASSGPAPIAASDGERKQATVLSCSLDAEPGAAGELDPEFLHLTLSRYFELAKKEVERYGGMINQFLGQGFLALFGAPITYEDHTRRAVLAALGLEQALRQRGAELLAKDPAKIALRIGIDVGPVVFGGAGSMAVGETTQIASRLMELATPGEILISRIAGKQAWLHARLRRARSLETEGGEESQFIYRVLGARQHPVEQLAAFARGNLSPFVGRQREVEVLHELRRETESGRGQVVGISGAAGSGKSRLLFECRKSFKGQVSTYLSGQCLSFGRGTPYLPLLSMIRRASYIGEGDSPKIIIEKLGESLEAIDLDVQASLPYLLRLLGVREGTESLHALEPRVIQARTFDVLRRMVLKAGQDSLVVLELEDLHWIDQTSEAFLASLVETIVATRLLVIATYRSGYKPAWLDKSYATQITMRRLSTAESKQVVESVFSTVPAAKESLDSVLAKAEGNPFFLEELARSLSEGSTDTKDLVPDTVQDVLMARIDRLPEIHKHLLQTASVLGRKLSLDVLGKIWDRPEPLDELLGDLKKWEFLYEAGASSGTAYFFQHALTQDVASHSLLNRRRQVLHAAVGAALEAIYADRLEEVYDRLVFHYLQADVPEKTVHFVNLFADAAARGFAHAEAAQALSDSLEHAERLSADRRDQQVVETVLRLASSLLPLASFPATLELLLRYRDRAAALGDDQLDARYFFWLAHTYTYLGNQDDAARFAHRAIKAAQSCADQATEGRACYVLGREGFWAGRFAEGVKYSRRAVVLLERSGEPWWQGQALWVAGFNHYVAGQFDTALDAVGRAHAMGQALADPRLDPSWSAGYFYASLGEGARGIECCQESLQRSKDPLNTGVATGFLGYAHLVEADLEQAVSCLERAIDVLADSGMQQIVGWFWIFLGEAHLLAGRLDEAADGARRGFQITSEVSFRLGVGLAQRLSGTIALRRGDADSRAQLERALELFEELEAPFEIARTAFELAVCARHEGQSEDLELQLNRAAKIFRELNAPRHLERAAALAKDTAIDLGISTEPPA